MTKIPLDAGERTQGAVPDPEVPARRARRRFTTDSTLEILRKADACTRSGELGALLRKEGLYSSHVVTWRRQRAHGLTPTIRGRKNTDRSAGEIGTGESARDVAAAARRGRHRIPNTVAELLGSR